MASSAGRDGGVMAEGAIVMCADSSVWEQWQRESETGSESQRVTSLKQVWKMWVERRVVYLLDSREKGASPPNEGGWHGMYMATISD